MRLSYNRVGPKDYMQNFAIVHNHEENVSIVRNHEENLPSNFKANTARQTGRIDYAAYEENKGDGMWPRITPTLMSNLPPQRRAFRLFLCLNLCICSLFGSLYLS